MYVATRGLYRMKPPTIIVPTSIKETVEELFQVHRKLDGSELNHNLIGLDVGNFLCLKFHISGLCCYTLLANFTPESQSSCHCRRRVLYEKGP